MFLRSSHFHTCYVPRLDRGIQGGAGFMVGILSFALCLTGPRGQAAGRRNGDSQVAGRRNGDSQAAGRRNGGGQAAGRLWEKGASTLLKLCPVLPRGLAGWHQGFKGSEHSVEGHRREEEVVRSLGARMFKIYAPFNLLRQGVKGATG